MVSYNCECCLFNTTDKSKYDKHLITNKHKKKSLSIIMEEETILSLRQEIAFLKGQLSVYKEHFKKEEKKEEEEVEKYDGPTMDALLVFDEFRETLELELDEPTIERIAELRALDDEAGEVNRDNFIEAYTTNEINFLSHIHVLKEFATNNNNAINDLIADVLKKCKIEVTEKYKGRFKLFHDGEWHKSFESQELLNDFIIDVRLYFKKCIKSLKYYYAFNSQDKELGDYDAIKPIVNKLFHTMNDEELDERNKYIINKVSSYH